MARGNERIKPVSPRNVAPFVTDNDRLTFDRVVNPSLSGPQNEISNLLTRTSFIREDDPLNVSLALTGESKFQVGLASASATFALQRDRLRHHPVRPQHKRERRTG